MKTMLLLLTLVVSLGCQSTAFRENVEDIVTEADLLVEDLKATGVLEGDNYVDARKYVDIALDALAAWKKVEAAGASANDRRAAYVKVRVAIREALVLIAKYRAEANASSDAFFERAAQRADAEQRLDILLVRTESWDK